MSFDNEKFLILTVISCMILKICTSEDILGCDGFIKSHANIDYSKVHIKLYTKAGILKDETECAPNGYYFIPLYDKGEYILKVEPPRGWSFEPTEVPLVIDGSTGVCSQEKEINFTFKGFGIAGKVTSSGSSEGPAGVTVTLLKDSSRDTVGITTTDIGGTFYFTPIQPGKYVLVASHPVWIIEKYVVDVTVLEGNTELPDNSLIISGYDVNGRVTSEDEPVSGVTFVLFGTGRAKNCEITRIKGFETREPLCHVTSDKTGRFTFPSVSIGEYRIIPHYAGARTKFDVQPTELSFKISHDSLMLPQDFKVTGFTVSGTVFASSEGNPLAGAKVTISGHKFVTTDENGIYTIEKMKAGQYTLKIEANDVRFDERTVRVSPSSPELSSLAPASYRVCGTVTLSAKGTLHHRKIAVQRTASTFYEEIETNPKTGQFCLYLAPGKYQFSVIVSNEEKTKGLQFFPLQQTIDVTSKPVIDINFLQLKAILRGSVQCLKNSNCSQVSVTLKVLDGITVKTLQAKDGRYEFIDILPGHYEVLIDTDVFCWENSVHRISVTSERAEIPPFVQTGFSVTFISSHDTAVEYTEPETSNIIKLELSSGSTRHCVARSGNYKFIPFGCHVYPRETYDCETSNLSPIILSSTEHNHRGKIISTAALDGVGVKIEILGETKILKPLKYVKNGDVYRYDIDFIASSENIYTITPLSDILLFNPPTASVVGINDCNNDVATFTGELGKIVSGKILPSLEGVTIQIFGKDKNSPVHTLVTDKDGAYRVGPLDGKVEYTVTAEKEGYVITGPDPSGVFHAHKLAEVIVRVSDQADDASLQGVLLSLSGGQSYRKNSVTGEDGTLTFNSLSPGEYFLRPMMKEYRFDPTSKMLNVEEGITVSVKLSGTRVAYSAYGSVTSLNGEAEQGLLVEAQGQSECSNLQEEATTEENGNFRIRGLQPTCIYAIRLKPKVEVNAHIQRTAPSSMAIQPMNDVHGIRLIAFYPISRTDISIHVLSSQPEHYRNLRVKMCREDQPDSPIHTYKLESQAVKIGATYNTGYLIHFPPVQANGKKYFVQLESSLSQTLYKYKTVPIYFEANNSFKHVTLKFNAERKLDQSEMSQTSVIALPFIMLVALAFFYREELWSRLNSQIEKWSKTIPVTRAAPIQTIPIDPRADDIIVEQIMNINKRKTKPRKT